MDYITVSLSLSNILNIIFLKQVLDGTFFINVVYFYVIDLKETMMIKIIKIIYSLKLRHKITSFTIYLG